MALLSNLLSSWYGLPFVSTNNILFTTINGTGVIIEIIYVLIFLIVAPKKEKLKIGSLFALVLAIFATVALVSRLALRGDTRRMFCGVAASVFSIIMYGSPLSVIRLVIKTKSVEYMPFLLSLFSFLCGTSWLVFGLLGHDLFVAVSASIHITSVFMVPSGIGCGLGGMQLILYFTYYDNYYCLDQKNTSIDISAELGLSPSVKAHQTSQHVKPNTKPSFNGHVYINPSFNVHVYTNPTFNQHV
ncbi:hypothetical protein RND81_02G085700 [Saponaria officinalis]|uniref:Bidirectional sugar transporter SWEET n=1 Tax=Saponaria officinalis TaxID=3572 RepID=A0AAW1MKT2_SAPOF